MFKSSILSFLGKGAQDPASSKAAAISPAVDARRHTRTDSAIPVALHYSRENTSVTIANLSPAGAMLQGAPLPSEGDPVHLVRGELCVEGTIIWRLGDRCGLEFATPIDTSKWLAPASHAGQARVDEIFALLKAGAAAPAVPDRAATAGNPKSSTVEDDLALLRALLKNLKDDLSRSSQTVDLHSSKLSHLDKAMEILADPKLLRRTHYQLVDELGGVLELLVELEDELAHTKDTVARHGYKLQHLDLAMQMLTELGSELITGNEDSLSTSPRLQNLRSVCENALKPPAVKPN